MRNILLPVFYMPPISWFAAFLQSDEVVFEQYENFPKQTYRNRANILGANGKLSLIIPIQHNGKKEIKDIEISYTEDWQRNHWRSIKSAYQSSPYFEFYEDHLEIIFLEKESSLLQLNLKTIKIFLKILKQEKAYILNNEYVKNPMEKDFRDQFSSKKPSDVDMEGYYQTFSDKLGFVKDLSILDLVCNKGPESYTYLKNINYL